MKTGKHLLPLVILSLAVPFFCAADEKGKKVDQSKPENVLQAVFDAAKSGEFESLAGLCPPADSGKGDRDVKRICAVPDAEPKEQASFRRFFEKGKIQGEPKVGGDRAAIAFTFGPDGAARETMKLVKIDGKWYLESF